MLGAEGRQPRVRGETQGATEVKDQIVAKRKVKFFPYKMSIYKFYFTNGKMDLLLS